MRAHEHRLGRVTLSPPGPIVAGSIGQWTLVYVVGSYGIDEGGTIKVARRFASDWERPQFDDPSAPAYTTVTTTGEAELRPRYDPKAHVRPWMKCLVIDVYDGCLAPGDTVTITLGDQAQGSPGIRAQSFIESAHELRVLVDPTNACLVERLPSSPTLAVIADAPSAVVVIVPTRVRAGEPALIFVKGEDRWGNPTPAPKDLSLSLEDPSLGRIESGPGGVPHLVLDRPGTARVVATWRGVLSLSNPATLTGATTDPQDTPKPTGQSSGLEWSQGWGRYWGDLHAQSDATVGTGTEVEYFSFGRDWAHLDVMCHQGNDFQMSDEDWRRLNQVTREFHEDGRFVVFPGYEWSANTAAGGDRNVMYLEEDMPILRSSHWQIPDTPEDERTPAHPADVLFERLREHVDLDKVVVAAHCGGRYADIRKYFDEEVGPLVEVVSCWGVFEWLLWDAFDKGYRVGVMGNSDGHKGRPGAEGPGAGQFGIFGGLTCMLSETLTRADVFAALKARRCYATTGPRIDLEFAVDGQPMGSLLSAPSATGGQVEVRARVRGTAPIEALQVFRGKRCVYELRPPSFADLAESTRVRLVWGGARIRGRGRRATWDGTITADGARIERAETFAFDSPADGILERGPGQIGLRSRTTGDIDGIDLWLDQAKRGVLRFESGVGRLEVDLARLGLTGATGDRAGEIRVELGGLDLHARALRYPEAPRQASLELCHVLAVSPGDPIFVKAIQVDGHMAWASPVYVGSAD